MCLRIQLNSDTVFLGYEFHRFRAQSPKTALHLGCQSDASLKPRLLPEPVTIYKSEVPTASSLESVNFLALFTALNQTHLFTRSLMYYKGYCRIQVNNQIKTHRARSWRKALPSWSLGHVEAFWFPAVDTLPKRADRLSLWIFGEAHYIHSHTWLSLWPLAIIST